MTASVIPLKQDVSVGEALQVFRTLLSRVLPGKEQVVDSLLCAILSSGHVLLEDVPGVGKTTVIKAVSKILGLEMKRVQCTSNLLPSDIIGVEVFNPENQKFHFHAGPVFAHIVLADELNRASPRTQSALLEAMGEGMVTVDKRTHHLPQPFILFAAQNPSDHLGTYPLPESQLDRFAIKIKLDYPVPNKETEIFSLSALDPIRGLESINISVAELLELQRKVDQIHIAPRIAQYVKRFVDATRAHDGLRRGVSTRGGVLWLRLARARALLSGREYVIPDDLITTGTVCLAHRVIPQAGNDSVDIIESLLSQVDIE